MKKEDTSGIGLFTVGMILSAVALYMFFDSVKVSTGGHGLFTGMMHHQFKGGSLETTSMGVVFLPFFIGIIALAYNSAWKWAWGLMYTGLGVLVVEMLSRVRFVMHMKSSHLLILIVLFGIGAGMMIRACNNDRKKEKETKPTDTSDEKA